DDGAAAVLDARRPQPRGVLRDAVVDELERAAVHREDRHHRLVRVSVERRLDDRRAAGDGAEARRLLPAARALAAPFAGERLEAPVRGARLGGRRAGQRHPQEDERVQHALGAPPTRKGCRATAPGRRRTWAYTARIMKAGRLPITDAMFLYGE